MRNAFAAEILERADEDPRVVLLSGDIGNRLFDNFKKKHPTRFFNCGVAEANMISLAAGLAASGLKPVAYTIAPFMTSRAFEQIRIDLCYHHVPVVVAGVGAGLCYASLGATHHSCEDIALMRMLPTMTVVCPADPVEVRLGLKAVLKLDGPSYLRLGKKGEPVVHPKPPPFEIGKGIVVRDGADVCILSTGNMLPGAVAAAEALAAKKITAQVVSFHTVKPLDEALLTDAFARFKVVVTVEEHSRSGGLGGSVAEWMSDRPAQKARLLRMGTDDRFLHEACDDETVREEFGLAPGQIAGSIEKFLA